MAGNVSSAKAALRRASGARRRALEHEAVMRLGGEVQKRLAALLSFGPRITLALYAASEREVPTRALFEAARASGSRCVLPRLVEGARVLSFREIESFDALVPAPHFRILEPKADAPEVALGDIDVFLVPGVAFSLDGGRLGRGGGHYDATLALARGLRVALAFECSVVNELPLEPTDVPMDALVTEERAVICRRGPERSRLGAADPVALEALLAELGAKPAKP